jgi:uncharacterized protein YccT (UPF0319 family)
MHNVRTREETKAQDKLRAAHTEKKQAANNETSKYNAQKLTAPLTNKNFITTEDFF